MPKISQYADGGAPQNTDKFVIARAGRNFSILWTAVKTGIQTLTDSLYVALTGNQTVAGIKSFSSFPLTPSSAPTANYEVANKKYVDDEINTLETDVEGQIANIVVFGNYKLVTSISANDLVLALKDLAGADFSATNLLRVKLSDTEQTITGALSVTTPDGTNWANLGSTQHATQDVDLFPYLILETGASAGVKLGWSRYPEGHVVGDFSSTNTNEKFLQGPTNYNATDKVQNIGRFNATLSAGAAYTWTIPATSIIKNRPFDKTRWLTWNPAAANLTIGSGTLTAQYKFMGNKLSVWFLFTLAGDSAVGGSVTMTLPWSINSSAVAAALGICNMLESGVATAYGSIDSNGASATSIRVRAITAGGTYAGLTAISSTIPFTWGTSDEINFQLPSLPMA